MGWYHVERRGKGKNIHPFDLSKLLDTLPDDWLPDGSWIQRNFPNKLGEYESMAKEEKLIYLGCLEKMPYYFRGPSTIEEVTAETAKTIFNAEDDSERMDPILSAIALIYCYHYGYPLGSFTCVSDYNHDWMFFCTVSYPPKEYNEPLAKLTEESFGIQLSEFLACITGDEYDQELEICEEYQKW